MAELLFRQARRDQVIDPSEAPMLRISYAVMRFGMALLVVSGFGFFLLARLSGHSEWLYEPRIWVKLILTGIILGNALLLQVRKIPLWLGAAVSIVSWYSALILGAWRGLEWSFWMIVTVYLLVVIMVAAIFRQSEEPRMKQP